MSSAPKSSSISPSDMSMLQTVLNDAGYDADVLSIDRSLFNAAALLVTKLFLSGETSPYALAARASPTSPCFRAMPSRGCPLPGL